LSSAAIDFDWSWAPSGYCGSRTGQWDGPKRLPFECGGLRYSCSYSRFDDGRLAELFLANTKPASQSDTNARDSAVAASLALQHGCSVTTLQRALLRNADE
jgi:hypothetical protein